MSNIIQNAAPVIAVNVCVTALCHELELSSKSSIVSNFIELLAIAKNVYNPPPTSKNISRKQAVD